MIKNKYTRLATATLLILIPAWGCGMPDPVRVMTFNIRYAGGDSGPNAWNQRRPRVLNTIRQANPDILGLQEVLAYQADELRKELQNYGFIGVGRDDGQSKGEFAPIMWRRSHFKLLRHGHFALAEDTDTPGIPGWDAALPRIATWTVLAYRHAPLNKLFVLNTHFDHVGQQARIQSARLIRDVVESMGGRPIIVMGDFNCPPGSPPYHILTADRQNLAELRDVFANPQSAPQQTLGTYHGFDGKPDSERIDWILHNRRFQVIEATINIRHFNNQYPSDHFPVQATLRLLPATKFGCL